MPSTPNTHTMSPHSQVRTFPGAALYRRRAWVLFAIACLWLLLPFANRFNPERELGPNGVLVFGIVALAFVLLPLFAFVGLILLTRRVVRLSGVQPPERSRLAALCLFLGPLGCLLTVIDLTTPRAAA